MRDIACRYDASFSSPRPGRRLSRYALCASVRLGEEVTCADGSWSSSFLLNTYKDYMIFTTYGFEKGGYIELTSHITLTDGSTR